MILLLYPDNIYSIKYIRKVNPSSVILIEDPLYFNPLFNKLKLIFHRASMQYYKDYLKDKGIKVKYVNHKNAADFYAKNMEVTVFYPNDRRIKYHEYVDSPSFLFTIDDLQEYSGKRMTSFYNWSSSKLNIPGITGKSYDKQNRKKMGNTGLPSTPNISNEDKKYIKNAQKYIGSNKNLIFPVTHRSSKRWLKFFMDNKFKLFGDYQDALDGDNFNFHSTISPMLNVGLLTPEEVISYVKRKRVKINSYEGFIRQIIGWREFTRFNYVFKYDLLIDNTFNLTNKLNKKWYNGTTGIEPLDKCIIDAFTVGYLHHIQRLMVVMNAMILCRIHPKDVYKWFMEFSVDSYDWVMVPNVYGMGYYSTEMTSKPYISSSNYLIKQGCNRGDWENKWDALFYTFIHDKRKILSKTPYSRLFNNFDKKSTTSKKKILSDGKKLIRHLTK